MKKSVDLPVTISMVDRYACVAFHTRKNSLYLQFITQIKNTFNSALTISHELADSLLENVDTVLGVLTEWDAATRSSEPALDLGDLL